MTDSDASDHISSIVQRAETEGLSIESAARIQKKADQKLAKILDMRNRDPVRAITGSIGDEVDDRMPPLSNVARVQKVLKDNRAAMTSTGPAGPVVVVGPEGRAPRVEDDESAPVPTYGGRPIPPKDQWGMLFKARLDDQQSVMPNDPEKHRIISKREAEQLLVIPKSAKESGDRKTFETALKDGWERAQKKFPPEYADRAFREAVNFVVQGDVDGVKANILAKIAKGRPITSLDLSQMRRMEDLDRVSLTSGIDAMARIDRAGRGRRPTFAPVDPALPAIASAPATVTQGDVARGRVVTPKNLPKSETEKAIPQSLSIFEKATRWFANE